MADDLVELLFELRQAGDEFGGHLAQEGGVQQHPGHLHGGQHREQGALDRLVQAPEVGGMQLRAQDVRQLDGGIHVGAAVGGGLGNGHLLHGDLLAPAADEFGQLRHLPAQLGAGERLETQAAARRVEEPGHEQRVVDGAGGVQPVAAQHGEIVLAVVGELRQRRICKEGPQRRADLGPGELCAFAVGNGNVGGLAGTPGDAQADEGGLHGIGAGGLDVEAEPGGVPQRVRQLRQRGRILDAEILG